MGLASKLQAGGGAGMAGGTAPPAAAAFAGASAPPTPTGYPNPYGPPTAQSGAPGAPANAPYGVQPQPAPGGAPSPYPSPYPGSTGPSPYPASTPYPGSAPAYPGSTGQPGGPPGQQTGAAPVPYPSPYPGAPSAPGMPAAPQQQQSPYMQQQQQPPYMQQQQGPYPGGMPGQAPPAARPGMPPPAASGASGGMANAILTKMNQIVTANQLQRFYPPQALQALAARVDSRVNFRDLATRWRMPVELALDLSSLALYDIILFADDSGSMAFEENGERIDDLKLIGNKVAEIATMFDDDGILVRFMNSNVQGNSVRSAIDVNNLLAGVQYTGLTPLASAMQAKVLQPIVYNLASSGQLQKPVLILTITDGEPTDNPRDLVVQVIKEARGRLAPQYGPKAVAFEFAQVGKDQRAQAFLGQLDTHPEVGGSIDCTSYFELESAEYQRRGIQLSPEMWLVKMMVGSIDPSYDEGDE